MISQLAKVLLKMVSSAPDYDGRPVSFDEVSLAGIDTLHSLEQIDLHDGYRMRYALPAQLP
jgi:hypothetical protein